MHFRRQAAVGLGADADAEVVFGFDVVDGVLEGDNARFVQLEDAVVKGKDTFCRVAAFHRLRNGAEVAFGDEVADVRGVHHHFHGDYPAGAVRARKEALGDEAVQVFCKFRLNLVALLTREEVVNPFQRLYGVGGVQGRETQVTGFGEVHRVLHGIHIPDFPDEDDVRRLSQ